MIMSVVATVVDTHAGVQNAITDSSLHFSVCMADSLEGPDVNVVEVGSVWANLVCFHQLCHTRLWQWRKRGHSQVGAINGFFLVIFLFKIDVLWFDSHSYVMSVDMIESNHKMCTQ